MTAETKHTTPSAVMEVKEEKRVNPTWEAFGKYKGAFTIIDPSILD